MPGNAPPTWHLPAATPALVLLTAFAGCNTVADWSEHTDTAALARVSSAQEAAFGRTEAFTIERPSETFRRRLMQNQNLPHAARASMSMADLAPIDHWPEDERLAGRGAPDPFLGRLMEAHEADASMELTLVDALQIAARSSRDYQSQKEDVFRAALALDLEQHDFHTQWASSLTGDLSSTTSSEPVRSRTTSIRGTPDLSFTRRLQNGVTMTGAIGIDLIRLLTPPRTSSKGVFADGSISIPLMRGAGRHIVAEPMIQAERNALYAVLDFERFKRTFAVQVASEYLSVLQQTDRVRNAEQNYRSLIVSVRQLRAENEAGRRPGIEVDQAVQNELQARDSWVSAIQGYQRALDGFRVTLGLPPDAALDLERAELERLGESVRKTLGIEEGDAQAMIAARTVSVPFDAPIDLPPPGQGQAGPLEVSQEEAVGFALENRLDLFVSEGGIYDAQRDVTITADALGADVTLFGSGSFGARRTSPSSALEADSTNLRSSDAAYGTMLTVDLPIERDDESHVYREAWIGLERAVRAYQELEDRVKSEVRDRLRVLLEAREGQRIEAAAVFLANRRVASAQMNLLAGRAQTRDLLEAQEDLVSAQNDLTAALVAYRIAELELQRDMGLLLVGPDGLWTEFDPDQDPEGTDEPRS